MFIFTKNKLNTGRTLILLTALLVTSCSSNRLPFIITAQYADRPVLIGQYKRPGEKIDISESIAHFESKQGTAVSDIPRGDFTINKLSRDILLLNLPKTNMIVIQEIKIKSSTWGANSVSIYNESVVKGKITGDPAK